MTYFCKDNKNRRMKLRRLTYLFLFLLLVPIAGNAQRKVKKAKQATQTHNGLFEQLLPSTAKVMFIDSVVVAKDDDWMRYIPMDKENGIIRMEADRSTYENGFGNYRLFAFRDTTDSGIYSQSLTGNGFSTPQRHPELSEGVSHAGYPFLAADGKTLYFSGEGKNSIGKRDIFMSVYNRDGNAFYQPENYGLPFNSTANDYLLIINDYDTLGWLVSDRFQPEGKVCIYTFVPTAVRESLDGGELGEGKLRNLALLRDISLTWTFGDRDRALKRLQALRQRLKRTGQTQGLTFVVNDNTVYQTIDAFRSAEAKQLYGQFVELRKEISHKRSRLDDLRSHTKDSRREILSLEQELPQQEEKARTLEKRIRIIENQKLR